MSVSIVSHSFFSQDFGHLTCGFRPWILFSVVDCGWLALWGTTMLGSSSSSRTGGLISCRLWFWSCCWTSLDLFDLLRKKYRSMQGPCCSESKHFFKPWCLLRPAYDVSLVQPHLQLWSLIPGVCVIISGVLLIIILVVCFIPGSEAM